MQLAFLVILTGALGGGLVVLAFMGWSQRRRRAKLAAAAGEMGMKFSASDPFNMTYRYPGFVLADAGHSPRAENVLYGRRGSWFVRTFDYRYEVGHGPGRGVRRYCVIVLEAESIPRVSDALLWHVDQADHAPLAMDSSAARVGPWAVVGDAPTASRLAEAFSTLASTPVAIQTRPGMILVCLAQRWKPRDLAARIDQALDAAGRLADRSVA